MKKALLVLALSAAFALPAKAGGGGGFAGATEFTQLANNVELLAIYVEQVTAVQTMLQQYQNMLRHTQGISAQAWPSIQVQIEHLVSSIGAVDGAANASAGALAQFAAHYRFDPSSNMASEVQRWRSGFRNQTAEALRQMGLNAARFGNTQQALGQIQAMSQTAVGRMQVLQAANQIAGLTVNEIQSLHGTIMAAEQAQLNHLATEVQEREAQEQIQRNFMRDSGRRFF